MRFEINKINIIREEKEIETQYIFINQLEMSLNTSLDMQSGDSSTNDYHNQK